MGYVPPPPPAPPYIAGTNIPHPDYPGPLRRRPLKEKPEGFGSDLIYVGFHFQLPGWLIALFRPAKRKREEKRKREPVNVIGDDRFAHLILGEEAPFTEAQFDAVRHWKMKPPDPTCRTGRK